MTMTFDELYHELLKKSLHSQPLFSPSYNPDHLDCLLHPERHAPVVYTESCTECGEYERACQKSCIFDAIQLDNDGAVIIDPKRCTGCAACLDACKLGKLTANKDILPAMRAVRESNSPVYALIAPAFLGQFGSQVTPGKLRSAFKALGFQGMVEVALFADILTMKEALEFDHNVHNKNDYQLTSCCCPMWIALIRRMFPEMLSHVPGSVSPMIACGRMIKQLHPDAVTIFIGPCLAKKSEAREPDIADAIDFVLTFQEVDDIFKAAQIEPSVMPENNRDHSSRAGRIYAYTGGVSEAVMETIKQLRPDSHIILRAKQADGISACKAMIEEIKSGKTDANFYEGMGCQGGCVGGPKAILNEQEGKGNVEEYGHQTAFSTPLENPFVLELLRQLDINTVEELIEKDSLLTRKLV